MTCEKKYSIQIKRENVQIKQWIGSTTEKLLILLHTNTNIQALLTALRHSVSKGTGVAKEGIGIHLYKIHCTYAFNPLILFSPLLARIQLNEGYFIFPTSLYELNCVRIFPLSDKHSQHTAKETSTPNLLHCVKNKGFIQGAWGVLSHKMGSAQILAAQLLVGHPSLGTAFRPAVWLTPKLSMFSN